MVTVALDEDYYNQINHLNPLWEQDALEWEYWHEEVRDWTSKLVQMVLEWREP